jgi:hypothetical protein
MKILLTLLLSFAAYNTQGQIKISYIFRDACNDSLYTASYGLFRFSDSKDFQSGGKDVILDSSGVYLFGTVIWRKGEALRFGTDKVYKKGKAYTSKMLSMIIQLPTICAG